MESTQTAPNTQPAKPTYTHIVAKPDRSVQHSFSLSGWNETARHAGSFKGYGRFGWVEYTTVCGKVVATNPDYNEGTNLKRETTNDLHCDPEGTGYITCNACRKKLGLKPLKKQ